MTATRKTRDVLIPAAASAPLPVADVILAASPVGFCLIDRQGRIGQVNAAFARVLLQPPDALPGASFSNFVLRDDVNLFSQALTALLENEAAPSSCEISLTQSDNRTSWAKVSLSALPGAPLWIAVQIQPVDEMKRVLEALRKSEWRWKCALESAHQGVWDHDFQTNELFYSDHWKRLRGLPADQPVDGSLEAWIKNVHPADREHVLEHIRHQEQGDASFNLFQYRERHADGHWVWIESRGASIEWGSDGNPTRIIGTDTDITERKKAEARLEEISRRLRLALDVSKVGVFEANLDTDTVVRDDRLLRIYGLDPANPTPQETVFSERLHPDDRAQALARVESGIASQEPFANAFRIVRPDGEVRYVQSRSVTFIDAEGARKLIGANWDITEDVLLRQELEQAMQLAEARNHELEAARTRIEYNALHDHLTGLPNRRYLEQQIDIWIAGKAAYCAILHIDLDRFKQINDTLGHLAGDAMLVHTAGALSSIVGNCDFVARIGGDEFLILCDARHSREDVIALTDRIIDALRQPVPYDGHLCRFGASVGIAWAPDVAVDAKQMLMNADIALYRAKGLGRNRYEFFTKQLQTQIHHAKRTADDIIKGLEDGEFVPFYQPQFNARTLEIAGVETLARWMHPRNGLLAPDYFLKIAEDINALTIIDRHIAELALRHFADWEAQGLSIPRISVNVSSPRLREAGLIESLQQLRIPSGKLSFELLESIFLDDLDEAASRTLADLKALGIEIEIDDFGTGHASIIGLMKLNPSRLKIDRALIKPITESPEQRKLVGSIIDIGHSLNIDVVAEGVETRLHADMLRDLGCDILQGYAFARPMPKPELEAFIRARSWLPAEMPAERLRDLVKRDFKA